MVFSCQPCLYLSGSAFKGFHRRKEVRNLSTWADDEVSKLPQFRQDLRVSLRCGCSIWHRTKNLAAQPKCYCHVPGFLFLFLPCKHGEHMCKQTLNSFPSNVTTPSKVTVGPASIWIHDEKTACAKITMAASRLIRLTAETAGTGCRAKDFSR